MQVNVKEVAVGFVLGMVLAWGVGQTAPTTKASSATKPTIHPVAGVLNQLPKNLWPVTGETAIQDTARSDWLDSHISKATWGPYTFDGTITKADTVSETVIVGEPRKLQQVSRVVVDIDLPPQAIWGSPSVIHVHAILPDVKPNDAISWRTGDHISISGMTTIHVENFDSYTVTVRVTKGTLKEKPTHPATPK